jgi:ABC-2 type transport system permease protein
MQRVGGPGGSIYDLGYRPYEGKRLGRAYAVQSLYWYSLRSIFGLGRSVMAKFFPWALVAVALLPAIVQIGIAAIVPVTDFEIVTHEGHFRYIRPIVALFCALAAPDLTGRDMRARTLTLYFSRALSRTDYVTAKLASLITAIFILNFVPQVLLMIGNAVATDDVTGYFSDNGKDILPIFVSSVAISVIMGSVAMAISAQSSRRAIATIAVLGVFTISLSLSSILVNLIEGDYRGYAIFISPMNTLDGFIYWVFNATPDFNSVLDLADLSGVAYLLGCIAYAAVATGWLFRRYWKLGV